MGTASARFWLWGPREQKKFFSFIVYEMLQVLLASPDEQARIHVLAWSFNFPIPVSSLK
jgi:hypothetical protein